MSQYFLNDKNQWATRVEGDISLKESQIIQPVDVQSRYSQTIQTHNAVSVGASASTTRVEVPTKGYSKAILMHNATGNAQAFANAVMSSGTLVTAKALGASTSSKSDFVLFDLNGIEKLSIYGLDTSGASNAITIEIALMA
jgi:hypothetical protein